MTSSPNRRVCSPRPSSCATRTVTRASDNVNVTRTGRPSTDDPFTDDRVLVAALRRGDEDAFAWLIDRYDGSLRRLARTYVASAAVADDVVADTWLAVVKGIDRFEGRAAVSTWLYRILANIARTRGVREHRTIPFSSAAGAMEEGAGPAVDPERFGVIGRPGLRAVVGAPDAVGRRARGEARVARDAGGGARGGGGAPARSARGHHAARSGGVDVGRGA